MSAPERKRFAEYIANYPDIKMSDRVRGDGLSYRDFFRRLTLSADEINCLQVLQAWVRERWPVWYGRRCNDGDDTTGKQIVAGLWADYLAWAEAVE